MVNGCTEYVHAQVDIYFEPDHVGCAWCPLLETYSRNMCRKSGEYIIDTRVVGKWCPLNIKNGEKNETNRTFTDA